MKTSLLLLISSLFLASSAFAAITVTPPPAKSIPMAEGEGKIFHEDNLTVVRKKFGPDSPMKRHNHPGAKIVLTVVSGEGVFTLQDKDKHKHELKAGDVLVFDGNNTISGEFSQETLIVVTLIEDHDHKH